jgi:hypothetical protein
MEFALIILHQTVMQQGPEMDQTERSTPKLYSYCVRLTTRMGINPVVKEIAYCGIHFGITSQIKHAQAR